MESCSSNEVMVRMTICDYDGILDIDVFSYNFLPETTNRIPDEDWVKHHIQDFVDVEDLKFALKIKEIGIFQILMKVKLNGWWSGWEVEEYDEELDILESSIKRMPDNWLDNKENELKCKTMSD